MKIVILKDYIKNLHHFDDLDNQIQADFVQKNLQSAHQITQIPFYEDLTKTIDALKQYAPDVVFNLVESSCGMGALSVTATQMLEALNIPYTGNKTYSNLLSADKYLAKKIMQQHNIPTPSSDFVSGVTYILKAKSEHASIGMGDDCVMTPKNQQEIKEALKKKELQTGMPFIAEQFIPGKEYNVAILGDLVFPATERCFNKSFKGPNILTYEAKWREDTDNYVNNTRSFDVPDDVQKLLVKITKLCQEKLNLQGYSRVDFRIDPAGNAFVIDLNTNPCLAQDASFIVMAVQAGMTPKQVIERILEHAFVS